MANTLKHFATGALAISSTLNPDRAFQLDEVRLHLSAAGGAGSFSIQVDSIDGSTYDVVLNSQDMTSLADYVYMPTRPHEFTEGDKLIFAYPNAGSKTYGLLVNFKGI